MLLLSIAPASAFSLYELVGEVVRTHPSVRGSEHRREAARAERDGARWQLFPTPAAGEDSYSGSVSLTQPMWWFTGPQMAQYEAVSARAVGAEQAVEGARDELVQRVLVDYGDWLHAVERMRVGQADVTYYSELQERIGRRLNTGASSEAEVQLVLSRLLNARAGLAADTSNERRSREKLARLSGLELSRDALWLEVGEGLDLPPCQELLDRVLQRSPEMLLLRSEIEALDHDVSASKQAALPQLYVRAERLWPYDADPESRLSVGIQWTPGAGLSAGSAVGAAHARLDAAQEQEQAQRRDLIEQINSDYLQYEALGERLKLQEQNLQVLQGIRESYLRQFLAGRRQWQEVMNAVRDLSDAMYVQAETRVTRFVIGWRLRFQADGFARSVEPMAPTASLPELGS